MKEQVYKILEENHIDYERKDHPPVRTVLEAKQKVPPMNGVGCKNLFLKDSLHRYYIYVLPEEEKADFKELAKKLNVAKIKFASEKELFNQTKLERGMVTPLAFLMNPFHSIIILIDSDLVGKRLLMHPMDNTATISIAYSDFINLMKKYSTDYKALKLDK